MLGLVVVGFVRIGQIEDDRGVRLGASSVGEFLLEVDATVEANATIGLDVNVLRLVVCGRVDDANVARLYEVVGDHDVLLVRSHLDVVWADNRLVDIGIVQALDVVQVADV